MDFCFDDIPSTSQSISSLREYSARVNIVNLNSLNIKYIKKNHIQQFSYITTSMFCDISKCCVTLFKKKKKRFPRPIRFKYVTFILFVIITTQKGENDSAAEKLVFMSRSGIEEQTR